MSGLTIGSIYAIVALGFVTIYSVTKVINLAQGEFVMLGGMLFYTFQAAGFNYLLSFIMTLISVMLIGVSLEKTVIRTAKGADALQLIILTIGLSIFIRGIASIIWGKTPKRVEPITNNSPIEISGITFTPQNIWVMVIMLAVVAILYLLIEKTILGKGFRACSDNETAAKLMGISRARMSTFSFLISAGIGALAGMVIAPIVAPSFDGGLMLGIKGFSAAILGGLGSSFGAVIGGLVIGLVESLSSGLIDSGWKEAISFTFLLILLLIRPSGLFSEDKVKKGGL